MDAWIISDNDDLISRIRSALQHLTISCPSSRIVSVAEAVRLEASGWQEPALVFLAAESTTGDHFELVHRIRSVSNVGLAVVSRTADHAAVLKSIRAGADDFLTADETLATEIEGFVRRLASSNSQQSPQGKQICIVPCHVPSDAGFLGVNASAAIAKRAGSCCLVDLQLRGGDAELLLNLSPEHTVYDLLTQPNPIDEAMFGHALTRHESGIALLAGPPLFSNLQAIQPRMCDYVLSAAQSSHAFVVVISEDIQHAEQLRALAGSECVLLTTRLDLPSLHRTQGHVEYLARNNVAADQVKVVVMNMGHRGELPLAEVKRALRIPNLVCIPDDPLAMSISINIGNPIVLDSPRSKTSIAIVEFIDSLFGWEKRPDHTSNARSWTVAKSAAASVAHMLPFCR